jgi:hypothetical protein
MAEVYLDPKGFYIDPKTGKKANGKYKLPISGGDIYYKDGRQVNSDGTPYVPRPNRPNPVNPDGTPYVPEVRPRPTTTPTRSTTTSTSTEKLLAEKKELTARIAANSKVDITANTAAERIASMEATKADRLRLAEVNRQLAGEAKTPPKSDNPVPSPKGPALAPNAPVGITDDLAADLRAATGLDMNDPSIWAAGAAGSTAFVYTGEVNNPTKGLTFKDGKPVSSVIPTLKLASDYAADFWNNQDLQNRIIGAYAAKGKTISTVEAYGLWSQLVTTAATIYQGGRGPKVTPLQLLNDSLKSVKGDEPTLPTRSISELDKVKTFEASDQWGLSKIGQKLDTAQKEELFDLLKKANTGTLTTYKKVKNKKTGKLENVQVTTPGLTAEASEAIVEKKLKESNPEEFERRKGFEFMKDMTSILSGGL